VVTPSKVPPSALAEPAKLASHSWPGRERRRLQEFRARSQKMTWPCDEYHH
jgi:hypothetical protein